MKALLLPSLALVFGMSATAASAKPVKLARHPDYNAGRIAFSYLGDIWVANDDGSQPRRLTVHQARDVHPRFSPDGKWIAFSSNRYGNLDVFVMPAEGGEPRQLTFHSGGDTVVGWSRDGKRVVFSAARGINFPGIPNLYEVPADGGLEQPLPTDWGYWGSYSPDGRKLAFNRHPMTWWRKHYRGSYAADLWTMDVAAKTFKKVLDAELPDHEKPNNFWPMYGNGEIFFVSDREVAAKSGSKKALESVNNIWKVAEAGGKPVQVTHHKSGSLFFPSISADGKVIVYEENASLYKLDTQSGRSTEVKLDIASDSKDNSNDVIVRRDLADSYDLSPSTKRAVVSARGELFTIATDRGNVTRVTRSATRDSSPSWSPDGKWFAFVSDQSGRDEVWLADEDGKQAKKLSDADTEKLGLSWSPDSKSLAYTASDHKLYLVDVATGQARTLVSSEFSNVQGLDFSPDGKWIAFTRADRDMRPHVEIVASAGGEPRRLSDDVLFASSGARFTPDGKKLIFLGGYVQGGSATLRDNVAALYSVALAREDRDPLSRDVDDEEQGQAAERSASERGAGRGAAAQATPEVKLEWEGLDRRIRQLTRLSDNITSAVPAPDSRSYAFVANGDAEGRPVFMLYTIQENGDQLRRLTQSQGAEPDAEGPPPAFGQGISSLQWAKDGRSLFFMESGGIWSIGTGGGGAGEGSPAQAAAGGGARGGAAGEGGRRRVAFTLRFDSDQREERRQVFNESWRVMKHRFYDAEMHGVDWVKMRAAYEPLLQDVGDREELQNVVSQMIGELNASHTGISGGGDPDAEAIQTRHPGFEMAADASGYYKVSHVYKRGPADKDFVKLKAGDFVLAIDGVPLRSGENYWKHLGLLPGRKLELTVNSKPTLEGSWTTRVEPVSGNAFSTLQYEKWVEERRQIVDKLSGGEIGYLHIRQMNQPSLRRFERDLADNRFKKAIVVDQRFNPGGGIDQELLQILQQRQYQYTKARGGVTITRPQRAYFGPVVVMQNERSTSDAEVFPDGFRTLKLGKTVGLTTYGAVIGTGSFRLMDGSQIRTPGTGLWNINGQNLENWGVPPDVSVDNTPEDFLKGRDAQLEKAVEVLKEELRAKGAPAASDRQ
jgi:tricorn protease